jgi:predicted transcriptional regulator
MKMKRSRSRDEIIAQILNVCKNAASKTRVVYQANLNFRTVNPYLDTLVGGNLIEVSRDRNTIYKTTQKGSNFLEVMKNINNTLSGNQDTLISNPAI